MDRRRFLRALSAAGLGGMALAGCAPGGAGEEAEERAGGDADAGPAARPIGVQLYTVRGLMERSVPDTLGAVAALGYREVETAGLFDLAPERFREEMDRVGLVSPAGHVPLAAVRQDLDAVLAEAQALGQRWVVVPWLEEAERTAEGYRALAADLNRLGAAAAAREMRAAYHNHEFEFAPLPGGGTGLDLLLAETDPGTVDFELDLYWATRGRRDPLDLFRAHPGRFPLWHVKDMADIGGAEEIVPVGRGEIDFERLFREADGAGLRHYFVEHDHPADAIESLRTSIAHLRRIAR